MTKGHSLELFFIDGKPDGMLTAEVFNWTGHVLMTPRTQLSDALKRPEARYTGVYVLLGEDDSGPRAYIGEGEDISARIRNHDTARDWWTSAVLVTTAANNLNKAHVKYLESRLIEEAHKIGKVQLDNGTAPSCPSLSEASRTNMENFLDYLLMVLPALRIDMFLAHTRPPRVLVTPAPFSTATEPVLFELNTPKHGISAVAHLEDGEFVVHAGAKARNGWTSNPKHGYAPLYDELLRTGVLEPQGAFCILRENYAFRSPSAAAAILNGRPANGTTEWKLKGSGLTYKEWEAGTLAKA